MKRTLASLIAAALALSLASCGGPEAADGAALRIAATTYPAYLFTTALTQGVEGAAVELMVDQPTSCLHDYTLTIRDMKILDRADAVVMNGAGLEAFLERVLAQTAAPVIDCSAGVELLPALGHEGHDHETEYDPHFWLCRSGARSALENIAAGLSALDPDHAATYEENLASALAALDTLAVSPPPERPYLITFHDGFQYFARESGLTLLKAIEEEEGAEASAAELKEALALVREYELPAIFTETNGSDAAAKAIARETGCKVYTLDTIMSGDGTGLQPWLEAMEANYSAIQTALSVPQRGT